MAAWNACDTAAMAELVTEDIVWADPALARARARRRGGAGVHARELSRLSPTCTSASPTRR